MTATLHSLDLLRTAKEVNDLHAGSIGNARRIGQLLLEVKAQVGHGNFGRWIADNCTFGRATAHRYIDAFGESNVSHERQTEEPTSIRQAVEQASERRRSAAPKPPKEPKKVGWSVAMKRFSGLDRAWASGQRKFIEKGLDMELGDLKMTEDEAKAFAQRAALLFTPKAPKPEAEVLSETAKAKFDRLLLKALAEQKAEQERIFWKAVDEKVAERIPQDLEEARATVRDYKMKLMGLPAHMSLKDYRFLLRILHPDRQPTVEERTEGFNIVRQLDGYIQAANR